MNGNSAFPKSPVLLEPHHQIVLCYIRTLLGVGFLPLCIDAGSVFYSPSRLGPCWGVESYPSAENQSVYSIALAD